MSFNRVNFLCFWILCGISFASVSWAKSDVSTSTQKQAVKAQTKKPVKQSMQRAVKSEPLKLSWRVSYFRNVDWISLTFKGDIVEFSTNTSVHQGAISKNNKNNKVWLGNFKSSLTPRLQAIKERVQECQSELQNRKSLLSQVIDEDFRKALSEQSTLPIEQSNKILDQFIVEARELNSADIPHGPSLRIGDQRIDRNDPCFEKMESVVKYEAWKNYTRTHPEWTCVNCAEYYKKDNDEGIVKIVYENGKKKTQENLLFEKRSQWKRLECFYIDEGGIGDKELECVDEDFGIFVVYHKRQPGKKYLW